MPRRGFEFANLPFLSGVGFVLGQVIGLAVDWAISAEVRADLGLVSVHGELQGDCS